MLNLRAIRRFALPALLLAAPSVWSASAGMGTLNDSTPANHILTYMTEAFTASNPTPVPQVDSGPRCNANANPCSFYKLTTTFPAGYAAAHPNGSISVAASWVDAGSGNADYDMHIYKGNATTQNGATAAAFASASGANPEKTTIFPIVDGNQDYTIFIVPYTATGEKVNVRIEYVVGAAGGSSSGGSSGGGSSGGVITPFGNATPTSPGTPRYQTFVPPKGSSAESSSGEYNIGFNPKTGRIMNMNSGPIWRITPAEIKVAGTPEVCTETWEDKSSGVTDTGLDPILWTDQKTGRTFASNSTAGANGLYAYTDNDGDLWVPVGASPPAGADHQTIGTGPYPTSLAALSTAVNQGQYVLYCTQDLVGANCQRSDNLGPSYGPAIPATGPGASNSQGCGGLHGHVRIGPDGTAYLPDNSCSTTADGELQGGALTNDAGTTPWNEFALQKKVADTNGPAFKAVSQTNGADPSIAIDAANNVYFCYINNEANGTEGHAHVAVGKRTGTGITWMRDTDVGAAVGVFNGAHTEAVGGSAGRAACGFIGTNVRGSNYQALDFSGDWYVFIATTFDTGVTWSTVNASPNDPMQHASGIWQQGGGETQRNTLDFNEVTLDDKGRVLYGYSDGCVSTACIAGTGINDFVGDMRVVRQIGGKTLLAAYDGMTDTTAALAPKPACLAGTRTAASSVLSWKVPDNGGVPIAKYKIFRGLTSGGAMTEIGETADAKPLYTDTTAGATPQWFYSVKAVNTATTVGATSNIIPLPIGTAPVIENLCALPGLTLLTDPSGDQTGAVPGTDLRSAQISQPYAADGVVKLAVTINTNNGQANITPNGFWYVAMRIVNGASTRYAAVRLLGSTTGAPVFEYYIPSGTPPDGRAVTAGSNKAADSSSSYASPYNKIVVVVKASDIGLGAGDVISGFVSGYVQPLATNTTLDRMPDDFAYAGSYTVKNNQFCRPNTKPVISSFTAAPVSGQTPLVVSFSASATDADTDAPPDTIAAWHLDFGDGSAALDTADQPAGVMHSYLNNAESGNATYTATLTATDSRGLASVERTQVITVTPAPQAANPISFAERTNVTANTFITSEFVTVTGFTGSLQLTPDSAQGQQVSVNNGPFTASAISISVNDRIAVRHISPVGEGATKTSVLKIGTQNVPFKTTNSVLDHVPDAFDFGTKPDQTGGSLVQSDERVLKGYDDANIVAGPGVMYSLNGAAFTAARGTIVCGSADKTQCTARIKVQQTANSASLGYTKGYVTIGGVRGNFVTRTRK